MTLNIPGHQELRKIVILNPKGGSGKTTLAMNLAGYFASIGRPAALMDFDPQGSSMRWLKKRPASQNAIYGVAAFERKANVTRSFQLRIPPDIRHLVVDTPAAMTTAQLTEFTPGAHAILVPVLPSAIDIHAASRLIADLLLVAKVSPRMGRLGVVANRVRENTLGFRKLTDFLDRLQIPIVGALRDSQNYVRAADEGSSVHEMHPSKTKKDLPGWLPLTSWLEMRLNTPLTEWGVPQPGDVPEHVESSSDVVYLHTHLARHGAKSTGPKF
jgi:chromosome partitioning protein